MCETYNRKRALKAKKNPADSEPYKRFKHRSIDEECIFDTKISKNSDKSVSADRKLISQYEEAYLEFIRSGISQKSLTLIRRILHSREIPSEIRGQPLFKYILDVYEKLSLSEIEVTVWAIYLDRFVWNDQELPLRLLLIISAYAAKSYLSDTTIFYKYITSKIQGFEDLYKRWVIKNYWNFEVSGKELNMKYMSLSESVLSCKDSKIIEYNYYVDEILQSSPPYRQDLKELSSGCEEDWDLLDFDFDSCSTRASNSFTDAPKPEIETRNQYFSFINQFPSYYSFGYTHMINNLFMSYPNEFLSYRMPNLGNVQVLEQIFRPVPVRFISSERTV